MSFSQGITGLNAAAANLDAIGNNIANSSTMGFKQATVAFKDVYAGSQIGLGVGVAGVSQNFAAGSVQLTGRPLDVAVTNGNGMFRVASADGATVGYTRNGQFNVDKDGYIVTTSGMRLTGHGVTTTGTLAGGTPTSLQLPTTSMTPNATSKVTGQFNFDSRNPAIAATFSATDPATYTYANSLNVYDSLGNAHELALYFTKTGPDAWTVNATADGQPLTGSANLAFDANGVLQAPTQLSLSGNYGNGSVSPATMVIDFAGSTQFGNTSAVQKLAQDGYTSGNLTSYEIGADGTITGKYSNDQSKLLGQVVLSSFPNPNGLESIGNNEWAETGASGQALTGSPGAGTTLGSLTSGALEASNVDLTSELVNLIIAQRSYQANAQTLKTQDQVMQTLVNLR